MDVPQRVVLLARLCSSAAFDVQKVSAYLNQYDRSRYINLSGVFSWIYNEEIKNGNNSVAALPAGTAMLLDDMDCKIEILVLDVVVTHFATFTKLLSILKSKYEHIEIVVVVDSPLRYFNDFCSNIIESKYFNDRINCFNSNHLYRIDIFMNHIENTNNVRHLISSNDNITNEKNFFKIIGLEVHDSYFDISMPKTIYGKHLNWIYLLPTMGDIIPLADWRKYIQKWENSGHVAMARIPDDGQFKDMESKITKYWRFAKRQYPELEDALTLKITDFLRYTQYRELTDEQILSFIDGMDRDIQNKLNENFSILRRGLNNWYKRFFHILQKKLKPDIQVESPAPKCTVITFAYNHENFIRDCIESVASQQLDCSLEHIIVDDASTDATPLIIEEMAKKYKHIKPILCKQKPPTTVNIGFLSCQSQYVALCDGDDYFTDKQKLHKQISFLDNYPDCSLCFHYANVVFENGKKSYLYPPPEALPRGARIMCSIKVLLQCNPMQTSSVMYRWRFREGLPPWFNPLLVPGDWYWHLLHAEIGGVGFIPEVMSVYRRHRGAVFSSADRNIIAHRLKYGMKELEFYNHCDQHFSLKYHNDFSMLANGVFANFVEHYIRTGDSRYMNRASIYYPDFAKEFLGRLKTVTGKAKQERVS